MEPAAKKVRIEVPSDKNASLKPSQVTTQSNIFGPSKTAPKYTLKAGAREAKADTGASEHSTASDSENEDNSSEEEEGADGSEEDEVDDEDLDDEFTDVRDSSEDEDEDANEGETTSKKRKKKNDPTDFATAMSKILGNSLTTTARRNPILTRSLESKTLDNAALDEKLEYKVRKAMTAEKKAKLEKGHNAVILGSTDEEVARNIERERTLRKTAQRGVVKLFNAIRAAQVGAVDGSAGQTGERDSRSGVVVRQGAGVKKREEKAKEMSKTSFLDLIKGGGTRVNA